MINKDFLEKYINTPSPTGYEVELGGQQVWLDEAKKFAKETFIDNYGNAFAIAGNLESDFTVVIDAHADEIAWRVTNIEKDGFIRVIRNGGTDHQIAPSMRVDVWTADRKNKYNGIFGHPAIHIHDRPDKVETKDLFVDIGASSDKEVEEMGIEVGSVITYQDGYMELGKNFITGRALDDKLGGYINIKALEYLTNTMKAHGKEIPYKLVVVNSVQEEIGLKGAAMTAYGIKPNLAFIIDVCHDESSPGYKNKQYKATDGCILTVAPSVHNKVLDYMKKTANENEPEKIKYKMMASGASTGTNTDSYAYPSGCPSALLSIPLRYMHTTVETVHKDDIKSTTDLLYKTLYNLTNDYTDENLFKYTVVNSHLK